MKRFLCFILVGCSDNGKPSNAIRIDDAYIVENVSSHATSVNKIADDLKELLK